METGNRATEFVAIISFIFVDSLVLPNSIKCTTEYFPWTHLCWRFFFALRGLRDCIYKINLSLRQNTQNYSYPFFTCSHTSGGVTIVFNTLSNNLIAFESQQSMVSTRGRNRLAFYALRERFLLLHVENIDIKSIVKIVKQSYWIILIWMKTSWKWHGTRA